METLLLEAGTGTATCSHEAVQEMLCRIMALAPDRIRIRRSHSCWWNSGGTATVMVAAPHERSPLLQMRRYEVLLDVEDGEVVRAEVRYIPPPDVAPKTQGLFYGWWEKVPPEDDPANKVRLTRGEWLLDYFKREVRALAIN